GTALPGTTCSDGNAGTTNDTWSSDCQCIGTPLTEDCLGVPGGSALPGTTCDDGNAGTTGDAWTTDCECAGTPVTVDCFGVLGGSALPGTNCNDNNANTINDVWSTDCECAGTLVIYDCLGVANGTALPGTTCDDGNAGTTNDLWSTDCNCAGTVLTCASDAGPDQVICGTSASLNAEGSGTWNGPSGVSFMDQYDPATTVTTSLPGNYEFTWTVTVPGCTATDTVNITFLSAPVANAGPDAEVCGTGTRMQASGENGQWTVPNGINAISVNDPHADITASEFATFDLLWTVVQGTCSSTDTVSITFHDPGANISVDAGPDQHLEVELATELYGSVTNGATVEWTVLSGTGAFSPSDAAVTHVSGLSLGMNTFLITASLGPCVAASDTVLIETKELFIPEGFSPNGDGDNDRFVVTGMDAYPNSDFTVFNRWGQKVYENNDYSNEWDGHSRNGQELPNDTYFYVLNLSGETAYNGFVVIKR
ncbi:MAG TPA: gliding motility-associated C-terminal domain-containing protein, partial [Flavobacteriales bacterium]|nr:gliding motility-associated C-terminal domain-containing protein [Flavobacteriales bacterium]